MSTPVDERWREAGEGHYLYQLKGAPGGTVSGHIRNCPGCAALRSLQSEHAQMKGALERAYDHLRFHEWKNDPGSDARFAAVEELRAALSPTEGEP